MYLLILVALLLAACGDSAESNDGRPAVHSVSENGDTAYVVERDDPEMEQARERSRCTLSEFRRRFRDPPATQTALWLKGEFRDDEATEFLWVRVFALDGDTILRGTVSSDPGMVRHVQAGDTVALWPAEVADWYAVDRDTLVGGFATRLFRARLPPADRAAEDAGRRYVIDPDSSAWLRLEPFCIPARL